MKNKPLYLLLFPLLALTIAASFPIQIHWLYKVPLNDVSKLFSMLTPLNLVTMITLVISAGLTLFLNRWIYNVVPFLLVVLFANNAIVGLYGTDFTMAQVALSFVLFGLSLKPFYKKEIKSVILNPKLRWWKTPKRYNIEKSLEMNNEEIKLSTKTLNLSSTGVFIKVDNKELLSQMSIDDKIELKINDHAPITLQAKVVRITKDHGHQPDGIGLEIIQDENHKRNYLPWFEQNVSEHSL